LARAVPKPAEGGNAVAKPGPGPEPGFLQPVDPGKAPAAPAQRPDALADAFIAAVQRGMNDALLPPHLRSLPIVHMNKGAVVPPGRGAWANPPPFWNGEHTDNSNTQFAILALWVARRHGVPMERTLAFIDHRFRSSQNPDGGWAYPYRGNTTNTMTCVGLLGLAMGHGFAQDTGNGVKKEGNLPKPLDPDLFIQRGLQKLGQTVGNPKERNLYFLWSVERVGVLYGLKTIGNTDWYAWESNLLLSRQHRDGHWDVGGYPEHSYTLDTCLALLILKRTNLVQDLADLLRRRAIADPDAARRGAR
jgi:hypothetical protein